jgi:hypothetical protein
MEKVNEAVRRLEKEGKLPEEIRATRERDGFDYTFRSEDQSPLFEIASVIANMGTKSNRNRLILGGQSKANPWGVKDAEGDADPSVMFRFLQRGIDEGWLPREVFDAVQELQDIFEETKPEFQEATMKISGVYVPELDATPYKMRFGDEIVEFRGGYVPAKYDQVLSAKASRETASSALDMNLNNALNLTHSAVNERISGYRDVVDLNFSRLSNSFQSALRYSRIAPVVFDLQKILTAADSEGNSLGERLALNAPEFWGPSADGGSLRLMFQRALTDRVRPMKDTVQYRLLDKMRSRFGAMLFSFDLVNAGQNLSQINQAAWADLGGTWAAHGVANWRNADFAMEGNPFMKRRMDARAQQVMIDLDGEQTLTEIEQKVSYLLPRMTQQATDMIIWTGGYGKWMAEMRPKTMSDEKAQVEARRYANHLVRIHGGSADKLDAAGYEGDGSILSALTQFANFSNYTRNHRATVWKQFEKETGFARYGRWSITAMMQNCITYALAGAIAEFFKEGMPEDEEELWRFVAGSTIDAVGFALGSMLVPPFGFVLGGVGASTIGPLLLPDDWHPRPAMRAPVIDTALDLTMTAQRWATGDVRARDAKAAAQAIHFFTGFPIGGLARQISYAVQVEAGEIEPTSTADAIRGYATGRPSEASR